MYRLLLNWIMLLMIAFSTTADSFIRKLQEPFSEYEKLLNSNPDKALELVKNQKHDSPLIIAQSKYILSSTYYMLVYPDKALNSAQEGIELINQETQPWLYHNLKIAESMAYDISGTANLGLNGAIEALQWAQQNNDKDLEILALVALGHIHTTSIQYVSALEYLQKAYELATYETKTHKSRVAGVIAVLYEERRENELSIPYFEESAQYHKDNDNYIEHSIALYGLGRAKANIGLVEEGKQLLQQSLEISKKVNDLQGVAYAQKELAGIAINEGRFEEAKLLLNNALKIFESANNKFMLFDVHKILASLALKNNQIETAKSHQKFASQFINETNQPLQNITLEKLSARIKARAGNFQSAYEQLYKTMLKEKKLIAKQSTQLLHLLRSEFELERKEKENQILATNNELQNIKLESETQKNQVLKLLILLAIVILALLAILIIRTRKHKLRFQYIANHDGLTGLYNRTYILEEIESLFQLAKSNNSEFNIAMIDLDHFKSINDTFGHHIGDQVLIKLAKIFLWALEEKDICGRFGGEEFLLVFPEQSLEQAQSKLQEIKKATLKISDELDLSPHKTSLSAGLCSLQDSSIFNNIDEMIKCADDALYQAKSNGRNTIVLSS